MAAAKAQGVRLEARGHCGPVLRIVAEDRAGLEGGHIIHKPTGDAVDFPDTGGGINRRPFIV